MRKAILRAIGFAVITAIIVIGCGDNGAQTKSLEASELLSAITGGGTRYTLTVNVTPDEGGKVSRSSSNTSYKSGEQVTVTAEHNDDYMFTGWTGASNDTATTVTVTMNNDLTLTAHFVPIDVPTYTLTVDLKPSDGGNVTREPNKTVYSAGEVVTVTTRTVIGYTFTGWSGDANGTDTSVIVTMNKDLMLNANFQQNTYTLSTNANPTQGGTVSRNLDKAVYTHDEQITVTATPADGYIFKGWMGDTISTNLSIKIPMNGNKTLTANFEQQKYTLTTKVSPSNYGTVSRNPNKETYVYGEEVTVTAKEASASGDKYYAFTGWTGALESTSATVTITMDDNKTLTANFKQETVPYFTLTTSTNPANIGTISRNPNNASYREGQTVTVTAPKVDGYEFTTWSGASTSTASTVTVAMDGPKTLTANYNQVDCILTIEKYPTAGGNVSTEPYKTAYKYGESVKVIVTENPGYEFTGWSEASTSTIKTVTITMNGNKKLTANFKPLTYKLNAEASSIGGGDVSRSPNKDAYNYNDQVTVTATPKSCYTFTGWSGAATGTTNPITITMNEDKALRANFQQSQYTLTTNTYPAVGGTVSRSPNQTSYTCGANVTVTAVEVAGYTFTGWSGASTSTNASVTITMDENKTLTANFATNYTLTANVSSAGGGSVTRSPNQTNYTPGTKVTVTATPTNNCYTFTGWSGDTSSTVNPVTVTMNKNKTITANFQLIPYTLTTNMSPAGGGSVSLLPNQTSYNCGTSVTVTATEATGYTFTGWTGASSSTSKSVTITMDGNKTLTANFQENQYPLTINVSGYGSVSPNTNGTYFAHGERVTVTAIGASSCYSFVRWSGASTSTDESITLEMDGKKELTAYFQENQYTITTNVSDGGYVSRSPDLTHYTCGTTVKLTATAINSLYEFNGWVGDVPSNVNASNASITFVVNDNLMLTPIFRLKTQKSETVPFNSPGTFSYTYNKGFPATVEVYVSGAGGGAAGGSDNDEGAIPCITPKYVNLRGGAGGGGAATYATFSIGNGTIFSIKVGQGGTGGAHKNDNCAEWDRKYGGDGGNGDSSYVTTTISGNKHVVVARGGKGGKGSSGGAGGSGYATAISVYTPKSGSDGKGGGAVDRSITTPYGGGAGGIVSGASYQIQGGNGGDGVPNKVGKNGVNGKVMLIFKWSE